jgi:hypothetical protein
MKINIIFLGGYFSAVIVDNFQLVHTNKQKEKQR